MKIKQIILGKCGELVLKGLNRKSFEKQLINNIKNSINIYGSFNVSIVQSTIYIEKEGGFNGEIMRVYDKVSRIFGIAAISTAAVCEKSMPKILETALAYSAEALSGVRTFKVEAKRADKSFALKSPEICRDIGAAILEANGHLSVDVHNPMVTVTVEVRDYAAYIHCVRKVGAGGLPYGTAGKACLMLSGGIDSPVAGYLMARRGLEICPVHFFSPPYTGELAKQKVISLAAILGDYCPNMKMHIVHFTEVQKAILQHCRQELFTVIMRRFMMRIAYEIMKKQRCGALITGESLGQVASQTMQALETTNSATPALVLRPLIGLDKEDIVVLARKIGTFETSIQPYEDCCTVFTPRHPKTKPNLYELELEEQKLDIDGLVALALEKVEIL